MNVTRHEIALTAATGDITPMYTGNISGRLLSVHLQYASAATTGFATTAAVAITTETTRQTLWSETLSTLATTTVNIHRAPRQVPVSAAGVALTATSGLVGECFNIGNDRLVITATAVGSGAKSATLQILTD